jgi:hypothetical protein
VVFALDHVQEEPRRPSGLPLAHLLPLSWCFLSSSVTSVKGLAFISEGFWKTVGKDPSSTLQRAFVMWGTLEISILN